MTRPDLVLTSARVVTPQGEGPAAVVVEHGVITAVVPIDHAPPAASRVDTGEAALLPGIVDTHVHVNEPGRTEWEGFESATRAAAAGGVTTIVDMPLNCIPVTTTIASLAAKTHAAAGRALIDYGCWGGVVPGNLDDLAPLVDAGVLGFKCFLVPSGIDEFPAITERDLAPAMRRLAGLGAVLLVHAELPGPIERAATIAGHPRRYATWLAARPAEAELAAIDLVLRLSSETGGRVHIVHLSSADALDRLAAAKRRGVPVTVETCPHYLTFAAEEIPDGATAFKCAPPLRERANRERLWDGLERGIIDLVASDHSPAPPALKCLESGSFLQAWGGIASLELALAAVWTRAHTRGHTLSDLARWLCAGPARLAGLTRKGAIAPGYDADFAVFLPDAKWIVDQRRLHQRHPITPYAGVVLEGEIRRTFVRGSCVYDNGRFAEQAAGRWLQREGI
jgi:allantoinase